MEQTQDKIKSSQSSKGDESQEPKRSIGPVGREASPKLSAAHTPGPWLFTEGYDGDETAWVIHTDEAEPWLIARVEAACDANGLPDDQEDRANARVLAAAPALYEALKATCCRYSRRRECSGPEMCDRCAALAHVDKPKTQDTNTPASGGTD